MPGVCARNRALALVAGAAVALAGACASEQDAKEAAWTVAEAESISSVRGLRVRVERCRGLGGAEGDERPRRYHRFACVAGARNPRDPVETVAVLYELSPRAPYEGPASKHVLVNVRFVGGPGIP